MAEPVTKRSPFSSVHSKWDRTESLHCKMEGRKSSFFFPTPKRGGKGTDKILLSYPLQKRSAKGVKRRENNQASDHLPAKFAASQQVWKAATFPGWDIRSTGLPANQVGVIL